VSVIINGRTPVRKCKARTKGDFQEKMQAGRQKKKKGEQFCLDVGAIKKDFGPRLEGVIKTHQPPPTKNIREEGKEKTQSDRGKGE